MWSDLKTHDNRSKWRWVLHNLQFSAVTSPVSPADTFHCCLWARFTSCHFSTAATFYFLPGVICQLSLVATWFILIAANLICQVVTCHILLPVICRIFTSCHSSHLIRGHCSQFTSCRVSPGVTFHILQTPVTCLFSWAVMSKLYQPPVTFYQSLGCLLPLTCFLLFIWWI